MKNNIFLTILILISILIVNQAYPLKKESQVDNLNLNYMSKRNMSELNKKWSNLFFILFIYFFNKKGCLWKLCSWPLKKLKQREKEIKQIKEIIEELRSSLNTL